MKHKRSIAIILGLSCIILLCIYGLTLFLPWSISENPENIQIAIKRGMTPKEISVLLKDGGIIRGTRSFLLGAKLLGVTRKLQAGEYRFQGSLSNYKVLRTLYKGRVVTGFVTFPEGTRSFKMASILKKTFGVDSTRFMALVNDTSFCRSLGIDASTLEGYIYPDTYRFQLNPTPENILKRMVDRFHEVFADTLKKRATVLGFSMHEVVTLASLVEGEAGLDSERTTIAALYLNRLKRGMLLQADPTIQYIIQDGPRRLLTKDLEIDSPYNTYIHSGLPPGPVNNPGLASLLATLYPSSSDFLYMVANGDGSHTFSRTVDEHIRAKQRFDRVRRDVIRD